MTDRAPTDREPRTEAGKRALQVLTPNHPLTPVQISGLVLNYLILAIEEEAAASPSCSSCHHPIHDFGDVGECSTCGCIENPATETGGLDPEWVANCVAIAINRQKNGLGISFNEALAIGREVAARLRSPSVGEDAQT